VLSFPPGNSLAPFDTALWENARQGGRFRPIKDFPADQDRLRYFERVSELLEQETVQFTQALTEAPSTSSLALVEGAFVCGEDGKVFGYASAKRTA
jgi:hypothetical protein